jgi:serine/threonine-protein kinase
MPALMLRIAHEAHPPIRTLRPGLPAGLDGFFDQALAKDPAARFAAGAEFALALRDINAPKRG